MPADPDHNAIADHIDTAMDHLLAVRVALGVDDHHAHPPVEALDSALGADERYQGCRRAAHEALQGLREAIEDPEVWEMVLDLESALTACTTRALDVGFLVAHATGQSHG